MSAYIFGPRLDFAVFLGSAAASMLALLLGAHLGVLHADTPEWAWVPGVLLVDVAHVWATGFRVYFDPPELGRRPLLYAVVPIAAYLGGVLVYAQGEATFWRVLAYIAVFHFIRQQYGFVAVYRARGNDTSRAGHLIDGAAIYAATLFPLLHWHAHLPRRFAWFLAGDFVTLPAVVARVAWPLYLAVLAVYVARAVWQSRRGQGALRKDLLVLSTALCWYVGIVVFDSDYAFTVTNVFIHGVPYLFLVFQHQRRVGRPVALPMYVGVIWALAYAEELIWDKAVWRDREWLFGAAWDTRAWLVVIVPALAVPQLTHYILDGFLWRRRTNPEWARAVAA